MAIVITSVRWLMQKGFGYSRGKLFLYEPFAKFQLACHNGARNVKFHASVD